MCISVHSLTVSLAVPQFYPLCKITQPGAYAVHITQAHHVPHRLNRSFGVEIKDSNIYKWSWGAICSSFDSGEAIPRLPSVYLRAYLFICLSPEPPLPHFGHFNVLAEQELIDVK